MARQQTREFDDASLSIDTDDARDGPSVDFALFHNEVLIGLGGHLGEVRHNENLMFGRELSEGLSDHKRHGSPDPGVDFVKNERFRRAGAHET